MTNTSTTEEKEPTLSIIERIQIWFEARLLMKWRKLTKKMMDLDESLLMFWYLVDRYNEKCNEGLEVALVFKHRIPEYLDIIGLCKEISTDGVKIVAKLTVGPKNIAEVPDFMEKYHGR